jgi:uncharacterized linocin/CFP29 family protein
VWGISPHKRRIITQRRTHRPLSRLSPAASVNNIDIDNIDIGNIDIDTILEKI